MKQGTLTEKRRLLIIGAGGVGAVVIQKCARMTEYFSHMVIASRTISKCDAVRESVLASGREVLPADAIVTEEVNADDVAQLIALMERHRPDITINVALPYQDLSIMEACLACGVHYLDTANYEPPEVAKFEYSWQWAYKERFEQAGLTAVLGCGFDPGVTGVFTAYAAKHLFDEIHYLDIIDCNAGDHGKAFATNFNPEINIREITQKGRYWEQGRWVETEPLEIHRPVRYPNIGKRESYLLFHEELESLVKNFPTLRRARFWMTFSKEYITHLRVLENVGMTSIEPIAYEEMLIQPLQFLKAVLPEPSDLGENYSGETSIGCQIRGSFEGRERSVYIYNNCKHQDAYSDTNSQAVSYTTGVPASIGALLLAAGIWQRPGVWNVEEFDPDPFLELLGELGLPWQVEVDRPLSIDESVQGA